MMNVTILSTQAKDFLDAKIHANKGILGSKWESNFNNSKILDFARCFWYIDMMNQLPWLFIINPWGKKKRSMFPLGPHQVINHLLNLAIHDRSWLLG